MIQCVPCGLGFTQQPGVWDIINMGVSRGFDVLQTVVTPPTYQSTSPGGSTTIRAGGVTPQAAVQVGAAPAGVSASISTTTILMIGVMGLVLVMAMKR